MLTAFTYPFQNHVYLVPSTYFSLISIHMFTLLRIFLVAPNGCTAARVVRPKFARISPTKTQRGAWTVLCCVGGFSF